MNMQKYIALIFSGIVSIFLLSTTIALPVSALTVNGSASVDAGVSIGEVSASGKTAVKAQIQAGKIPLIISKADQEITRRITALNELGVRVQSMQRVSDAGKAQIKAQIDGNVKNLTDLKTKIDADTDIAVLKTDGKSITDSYRIFVLVIPQGRILAAGDKIVTVGSMMNTVGAKLQARIDVAQTAGKDVSALQKALTDMNAKLTDAGAQAQAAVNTIASLTPDQGDKAKMDANHTALVDARSKIKVGSEDLRAARKAITIIIKGLQAMHLDASASASSTMTTGH